MSNTLFYNALIAYSGNKWELFQQIVDIGF
jgi:hypothetical protein